MTDKKILILGGEGYIGSHLCQFLWNKGINVETYGNRSTDFNLLFSEYLLQYEYIILLAGHSSVGRCIGELKSSWNNNVRNFYNLMEKTKNYQKIIYASSSSVYGNKGGKIFNEEDISLEYINNYDLTKTSLDLLANQYQSKGRQVIGLRFGTVNGGSTVIRRDLMINAMVHTALNEGVIKVNNKNVNRPILAINDLSRAIYTIITNTFHSGAYNLSSFYSNVDEISKLVKLKTNVDIVDKGEFPGVYNFITDTTKFETTYNFKFEENIESIIENVIDCYKNQNPNVVIRNEYFDYKG